MDIRRSVLVIEDDTELRRRLQAFLEADPALTVVGTAEDGVRGLEAIRALRPDVVLLDLRMPVLDGFGVLEALTAIPEAPEVVVLTAEAHPEVRRRCMALGAREVLDKLADLGRIHGALRGEDPHPAGAAP